MTFLSLYEAILHGNMLRGTRYYILCTFIFSRDARSYLKGSGSHLQSQNVRLYKK